MCSGATTRGTTDASRRWVRGNLTPPLPPRPPPRTAATIAPPAASLRPSRDMPHPLRRETLETLPRALLLRALAPYAAPLADRKIALEALATPTPHVEDDRALHALFAELTAHKTGSLGEIGSLLADVSTLASEGGIDALAAAAKALGEPPLDTRGAPAEVACRALLDRPHVFRHARASVAADALDRFVEYQPDGAAEPHDWQALGRSLATSLAAWFSARDQTSYVDVLVVERRGEAVLEVVHGTRQRSGAYLEPRGDDAFTRVVRSLRELRRDYLVVDEGGRLTVRCCSVAERKLYRLELSRLVGGRDDHFSERPILSLDGLLQGAPPATEGIDTARLTRLALRNGLTSVTLAHPADLADVLRHASGLTAGATVREARLALVPTGKRRPRTVELTAPSGLTFDHDEAWERVVRRYLTAAGVLAKPWRDAPPVRRTAT